MTDHVVDFSDAPTEAPNDEATAAPARRGRPRPQETIQRDEAVLAALRGGPLTKEQLVEAVKLRAQLVYLSLYRLRRDGKVVKIEDGDVRHQWQVVE